MEKEKKQLPKEYKPGDTYEVPVEGSLGLLALGHRGLEAWRKALDDAKKERTGKKNLKDQTSN